MIDGRSEARSGCRRVQAEIGEPHDLALAHRNAAEHLRHKLAGADPNQKLLGFAESAGGLHPPGIGRELPDRFGISRKPGKAVRRALLAVEQTRRDAAVGRHARSHGAARIGEQRLGDSNGFVQNGIQVMAGGLRRYGKRHGRLRKTLSRPDGFSSLCVHCTKSQLFRFFCAQVAPGARTENDGKNPQFLAKY